MTNSCAGDVGAGVSAADVGNPAALFRRLLDDLPELSAVIVARTAADVPSFRSLPDAVLQVEIRAAVQASLGMVLRSLVEGGDLDSARLGLPLRQAMARVEDRLAFADILSAYFIGAQAVWQRLRKHAGPGDIPVLLATVEPALCQMQRLFVAAAQAYLDEQRVRHSEAGEARRELAAALLSGRPASALALRAGIPVAPAYVVLVWQTGASPQQGHGEATLLRRRRIRGALDDRFQVAVLTVLEERGGVALAPLRGDEAGVVHPAAARVIAELREFVAELREIVGEPVTAAAAVARQPEAAPEAEREAREVLDVALRLGRPAGLYLLDDLILEVQLARPGAAGDRLAERLGPLAERPELLSTLGAFLTARQHRRRTAAALHVHPNTLDYRLRRIAEITGLDPARPDDMRVLAAAFTARQLRCGDPG